MITSLNSPNFNERPVGARIEHLVFHYTELSLEESLQVLTQEGGPNLVSCHYVIGEDGALFSLVEEEKRAWHAGDSFWRGQENINNTSIGIEIVNDGKSPYAKEQMEVLLELSQDILQRHDIRPYNIVGHSDIAPHRKRDPGKHFDWAWLAEQGISLFPEVVESQSADFLDVKEVQKKIRDIGYRLGVNGVWDTPSQLVLQAFQSRFMDSVGTAGELDSRTCSFLHAVCHEFVTSSLQSGRRRGIS